MTLSSHAVIGAVTHTLLTFRPTMNILGLDVEAPAVNPLIAKGLGAYPFLLSNATITPNTALAHMFSNKTMGNPLAIMSWMDACNVRVELPL